MDYINLIRCFSQWELHLLDLSQELQIRDLYNTIISINPDFAIILYNDRNLLEISDILKRIRDKWSGKLLFFCPVDFTNPLGHLLDWQCDAVLTMTDWARDQIITKGFGYPVKTLEHVVEDFYEYSSIRKMVLRKEFYRGNSGKFIVGAVNANNSRKRLDLTVKAFELFHRQVPDSLLVIKTTEFEQRSATCSYENLNAFADVPMLVIQDHLSRSVLNDLYNTFDLMIDTTDGEGFGLTPFECCLSGTLCILPYHSAFLSLLPYRSPYYAVGSEGVPYEYARNTTDYTWFSGGNDRLTLLAGKSKEHDFEPKHATVPSKLTKRDDPHVRHYLLSLVQDASDDDRHTNMEGIVKCIRDQREGEFQISVTSDLASLRYYLNWLRNNPTDEWLTSHTSIGVDPEALNNYVGTDQPMVGIVDVRDVCERMLHYYRHPEEKVQQVRILQKHVKRSFSSQAIFDKLKSILEGQFR